MPVPEAAGLADRCSALLRDVQDFPRPGIVFKDITPVLADGEVLGEVVAWLAASVDGPVDLVAGAEARGFILGAPVATALGAGFVPVRKPGKLPGPVLSAAYELEYGATAVEVHPADVPAGARTLVVDDVLATGGTAAATASLLEDAGAVVVGLSFLVELGFLSGRAALSGRPVSSLVTVP